MESPIIVSQSIFLEQIKPTDAERLAELADDPEMRKNVGDMMPYPYTLADANWRIAHSKDVLSDVLERQYGIYIDDIYAWNIGRNRKSSTDRKSSNYHFGYRLWRPYWGKWYMTQIVDKFTQHMFKNLTDCHRIRSEVYGWNEWSRRVLEKCWFSLAGTLSEVVYLDEKRHDEWIYEKVKK